MTTSQDVINGYIECIASLEAELAEFKTEALTTLQNIALRDERIATLEALLREARTLGDILGGSAEGYERRERQADAIIARIDAAIGKE